MSSKSKSGDKKLNLGKKTVSKLNSSNLSHLDTIILDRELGLSKPKNQSLVKKPPEPKTGKVTKTSNSKRTSK